MVKPNFVADEVWKVAKALLELAVYWDDGDTRSFNPQDGYRCSCCEASEAQDLDELKHDKDCPVLIAQDLLTGCQDS